MLNSQQTPQSIPYARWLRLESEGVQIGIANSGQNGFDVSADGVLTLGLSRGAIHYSWEGDPSGPTIEHNQSYTFMDQQQIDTRFRILAGQDVQRQLVSAALELNQPLERFFAYHLPTVPLERPFGAYLSVTPPSMMLGALKKAEAEDALIIRLAETIGQSTIAEIRLEDGEMRLIPFSPFEIKTFQVRKDGTWEPTNLVEEPAP